ncbi:unnamed protein product [Bemisia tabaci]|uniref:Uncharacterized protein n=1 Tax=Bemisia tabaci TaxID=7038 RepID=A0A9P0AMQ6_BEMTA|nr:unnamed protein product [Bemisia tabaci]
MENSCANLELNEVDKNMEVSHSVFVKEEFPDSDPPSGPGIESIDFDPLVKLEDGTPQEEIRIPQELQSESTSSSSCVLAQVKIEVEEEDYNMVDPLQNDIDVATTEAEVNSNQSLSRLHEVMEEGEMIVPEAIPSRGQALNFPNQIKREVCEEDDHFVSLLHPIVEIRNELPVQSSEYRDSMTAETIVLI